jgi:hypothetical protein
MIPLFVSAPPRFPLKKKQRDDAADVYVLPERASPAILARNARDGAIGTVSRNLDFGLD